MKRKRVAAFGREFRWERAFRQRPEITIRHREPLLGGAAIQDGAFGAARWIAASQALLAMTMALAAVILVAQPAWAATAQTCRAAIGEAAARTLVERCRFVSPATHPPCNASNPCALITGEIKRGCAMLPSSDAPPYCAAGK